MDKPPAIETLGSGRQMLHGSFWMISLRWAIRLIGLVSTVILARLLSPSDFGIVAMAMFVVGMLEVLNQTGQRLAIIRLRDPTREDYDTAWTISAILGSVIAVAILLLAPLSKLYFQEQRAVIVMQCLALRAIIGGLENIGTVNFRRDIQFNRLFSFNVYPKLISFVVTIVSALALKNYWALVIGILTGQIAATGLSYFLHPYRPRFSLSKISKLWSFSTWTFMNSLAVYLNQQIDQVVIGGIASAASMGRYAVASDVSATPSQEILSPIGTVLYPVMAKLQGDLVELRAVYLRTLGWSAIICTSTGIGIALIAPELVQLILGSQWDDIVPLMGWLALSAGILGLGYSAYVIFDVLGKPHIGARMQWIRLVMLLLAIVPVGFMTHDLTAVAATRFVVTLIFLPALLMAAGNLAGVTVADYIGVFWRPTLAAMIMALAVKSGDSIFGFSSVAKLICDVLLGCAVYSSTLLFSWWATGRPISPERDALYLVRSGWKRWTAP